jgi:hypothetical protein
VSASDRLTSFGSSLKTIAQGDSAAVDTNPQQPGAIQFYGQAKSTKPSVQHIQSAQIQSTTTAPMPASQQQQQQQPSTLTSISTSKHQHQQQHRQQPVLYTEQVTLVPRRKVLEQEEQRRRNQQMAGVFFLVLTVSTASLRQAIIGNWALSMPSQYQPPQMHRMDFMTPFQSHQPPQSQYHHQSPYHHYQQPQPQAATISEIFKPLLALTNNNSKRKRVVKDSIRSRSSQVRLRLRQPVMRVIPTLPQSAPVSPRTIYLSLRGNRQAPAVQPAPINYQNATKHFGMSSGHVYNRGPPPFVQINVRINLIP